MSQTIRSQSQNESFDFDAWKTLAQQDPQAFEQRRRAALNQLIASAPTQRQQRLKGLQWRIDTERKLSANPTASCLNIYQQMWDRVYSDGGLLEQLNHLCEGRLPAEKTRDFDDTRITSIKP